MSTENVACATFADLSNISNITLVENVKINGLCQAFLEFIFIRKIVFPLYPSTRNRKDKTVLRPKNWHYVNNSHENKTGLFSVRNRFILFIHVT